MILYAVFFVGDAKCLIKLGAYGLDIVHYLNTFSLY